MSDKIDKLLKFDALSEAERLTGVSYKDKDAGDGFDNPATALGLLLLQSNGRAKEAALLEVGDTLLHNELPRYRSIVEGYGFEQVLADQWKSTWGDDETYFIFAHRKGLLLSFDTFNGKSVNGGKVYYNWRPASLDLINGCMSSGSFDSASGVWCGDHYCREGLIHNLSKMDNRGEFVTPWTKRPFLWLLHFDEAKVPGYDYKAIVEARIKRLPQWVQDFIGS